ncbi:Hypothetical predicted protein [Cloeon dipterum]|uniref:Uncharacterized protein n=1 Tax=Cloeon dipterum TaxID=197152 RepID=A0A8S1EB98_9INSE|nr:Hypothetical predicted protein [Cloeon dipterum]
MPRWVAAGSRILADGADEHERRGEGAASLAISLLLSSILGTHASHREHACRRQWRVGAAAGRTPCLGSSARRPLLASLRLLRSSRRTDYFADAIPSVTRSTCRRRSSLGPRRPGTKVGSVDEMSRDNAQGVIYFGK